MTRMCSSVNLGLRGGEQKAFDRTPKLSAYSYTYFWHTFLDSSDHTPVDTNTAVFQYDYRF